MTGKDNKKSISLPLFPFPILLFLFAYWLLQQHSPLTSSTLICLLPQKSRITSWKMDGFDGYRIAMNERGANKYYNKACLHTLEL